MQERYDIVFVGGGPRTVGVLTATPELLARRVAIVEQSDVLGPGQLGKYRIFSNSLGTDYLRWITDSDVLADITSDGLVRGVCSTPSNVPLEAVGRVFAACGRWVQRNMGSEHIYLRHRAVRLSYRNGQGFTVYLADGSTLRTGIIALATGIREAMHPSLEPHRNRVMLSGEMLTMEGQCALLERYGSLEGKSITIMGGAHSSFSVAHLCLSGVLGRPRHMVVAHRSLIRLFSTGVSSVLVGPWTHFPAAQTDLCPETGTAFRYSGLRGAAANTFREMISGVHANASLLHSADRSEALDSVLSASDLIIQATGYHSRLLPLEIEDREIWTGDEVEVVRVLENGLVRLDESQNQIPLYAAGLVPNPTADNGTQPNSLYSRIGECLLSACENPPSFQIFQPLPGVDCHVGV